MIRRRHSATSVLTRLLVVSFLVGWSYVGAEASSSRTFSSADVVARASGYGSIVAVALRDGIVCAVVAGDPSRCTTLGTLPADAIKILSGQDSYFDGVFDLLGDSAPQLFIDYWPDHGDPNCLPPHNISTGPLITGKCDAMALLVYRYSHESYTRDMTLNAPSMGYSPGAWFLRESPPKAIFETRYAGSFGPGLFYLDPKKRSLDLISDHYDIEGDPIVENIERNGNAELFIPARGRDRTATQGAALLRWTGRTYSVWWPDWNAPPYVVHAKIAEVGGDPFREIVAILDSADDWEKGSSSRELAVWKLTDRKWHLNAKTELPSTDSMGLPDISAVVPERRGARVVLMTDDESGNLTCHYSEHKITCPSPVPPPTN